MNRRSLFSTLLAAPLAALGLRRKRTWQEEFCDFSGPKGPLTNEMFVAALRSLAAHRECEHELSEWGWWSDGVIAHPCRTCSDCGHVEVF